MAGGTGKGSGGARSKSAAARNLYCRNGIWWYRIEVNGVTKRGSLHVRSRAEAEKLVRQVRTKAAQNRAGIVATRFEDAVIAWANAGFGGVKPSTAARYQLSLRTAAPFLARRELTDITPGILGQFIAARQADGVTNASIKRDLTALSRLFAFAKPMGWMSANPVEDWQKGAIRERRDPITRPDPGSLAVVFAEAERKNPELARLLRLLLATGLRLGEATSLRGRHIADDRSTLTVAKSKTGAPRVVTLTDEARACLPDHLAANDPLFPSLCDKPTTDVSSMFGHLRSKVAPDVAFRIHDLRHEFAIRWLESKRDGGLYKLQINLGHSSIKTTEIYLAHVSADAAEKARKSL